MATNRWLDVSTDWTAVANWSLGAAPVSTNDVIIDDGNKDIDTNLDQNAVDLNSLKIGPGFTGDLGASGNPLKIGSGETWVAGGGKAYLEGKTAVDLPVVHVDKAGAFSEICQLGGFIGEVNVLRGRCEIAANFGGDVALNFRVARRDRPGDAELIIGSGGTVAELVSAAGRTVTTSPITLTYQSGGSVKTTLGAIATYWLFGGTFYWECDETITDFYGFGGKLDARQNLQTVTTPTVTNGYVWPGCVVDLRNGIGSILFGGGTKKLYGGGYIYEDV